jgi:Zn-dependent M28 family amino/carboxypeptidase
MRNILAQFRPDMKERVLYVTHWDTRPTSDRDPNIGRRSASFDGANDGASGVGLFVALADLLNRTPPSVGVDLLFVDGEDWGNFDEYPGTEDVLIGSTYFARNPLIPNYQPLYGVVWDMIGDADLVVYQESNSLNAAREVVERVWQTARDLGYNKHFPWQDLGPINDDHIPLINIAKWRVIDVIDINYHGTDGTNYHHTSMDTMDKISAKSLQVVGDVAFTLVR